MTAAEVKDAHPVHVFVDGVHVPFVRCGCGWRMAIPATYGYSVDEGLDSAKKLARMHWAMAEGMTGR